MGIVDLRIEHMRRSEHWGKRHKRLWQIKTRSAAQTKTPSSTVNLQPPMDNQLYESAKQGDVDDFISALEKFSDETKLPLSTIFLQRTPQQDTFLHVAATFGHEELAGFIVHHFRRLLHPKNHKGDTALHLASRMGHLGIVEILSRFMNHEREWGWNFRDDLNDNIEADYSLVNHEGNMPLHEALISNHKGVAEYLLKDRPNDAFYANKEGKTGLYYAVEAGDIEYVKRVFDILPWVREHLMDDENDPDEQLAKGKSIIHAAVSLRNTEMLQEIVKRMPRLIHVKDENGKNPLEYASLIGFDEGVKYLLTMFETDIIVTNSDDSNQVMLEESPNTSTRPPVAVADLVLEKSPNTSTRPLVAVADLKIEDIRHSTLWLGRHEKMKKLLDTSSIQILPEQAMEPLEMDLNLCMAAKKGDVDGFISTLTKLSEEKDLPIPTIFNQLTPLRNTFLHVTASWGHEDLTGFIVHHFRGLLTRTNHKGNTPLHEAAKAGHRGVVDILMRFKNDKLQKESSVGFDLERNDTSLYGQLRDRVVENDEGNTPLHEALINGHEEVARDLIKDNVEEAYYINKEGKSALYMAVECGNIDFVKTIVSTTSSHVDDAVLNAFGKGKSLIHAALSAKNIVILQEIAKKPALIHVQDEYGQNPLHYAVSSGFLDGVNCLLSEFKMDAFEKDANGLFPIHLASKNGHLHILQKLLQYCPDATEFVNKQGRTILHIAAMYGQDNVVRYILKTPGLERLINERDEYGNTPLQLATINWHPKVVSSLSWDRRVNLKLLNNKGLTALDLAEEYMETMPAYRKRLTWMALKSAGAPKAMIRKTPEVNRLKSENYEPYNMDYCKDRVNTLLLVATLVATVTFAAGFTMPGGYNNSETDQGMAILLNKHKFQVFVICDTIAMYSAVLVIVTLIWAQLGDLVLVLNALRLAIPLLGVSLTMMSLAFMVSLYLVVSKLLWLADVVLIMGIISLASILTLFIPLCLPYTSSSLISRYISYYPFRLLILASRSYSDRDLED